MARMEDTRLPKCVMFGETVGGAGCVGGEGKRVDGVFPGRSQSFRHQRRPMDDCSPGRGGMAQNGRTRGGAFHGEMDRCRENQGWTTACSGMPERDGKNQEEDSPKASGLVLVRSPLLTSHKWRELVSSGRLVCRYHGVFSLVLRLFCFASYFVPMLSLKPRPFAQSSFRFFFVV